MLIVSLVIILGGIGWCFWLMEKHGIFFWSNKQERWAAYYTQGLPVEDFLPYDLLVFDRGVHPPLAPLKEQKKILLGYISLGEAETYRDYFPIIKDKDLLLPLGPEWQGNPVIDVRNPLWEDFVIDQLIPPILNEGFNGIMIDTVDSIIHVETVIDPVRYAGLQEAMVHLIHAIRLRYPTMKIMLNRGFEILPKVIADIDMVLAESIYTHWKGGQDAPVMIDSKVYQHYVELLHIMQRQSPTLKIYTLDYWPLEDSENIRRIYAVQRAQGFIPYVTTPDLQKVTPEP